MRDTGTDSGDVGAVALAVALDGEVLRVTLSASGHVLDTSVERRESADEN